MILVITLSFLDLKRSSENTVLAGIRHMTGIFLPYISTPTRKATGRDNVVGSGTIILVIPPHLALIYCTASVYKHYQYFVKSLHYNDLD